MHDLPDLPDQPDMRPEHHTPHHTWHGVRPKPDAGSRRASVITLLLLVPVLGLVIFFQQSQVRLGSAGIAEKARNEVIPPSTGDGFTIISKIMVKGGRLIEDLGGTPGQSSQFLESVDTSAHSPSEVLRSAIVAGELSGDEAARERLERAASLVYESQTYDNGLSEAAGTMLLDDITALDDLYQNNTISDTERQGLIDRHGWFGELALARNGTAAERNALLGGGGALFALLAVFGGVIVLVLLAGFVMLILAIVLGLTGKVRPRFEAPVPGGSVYLETFGVFVAGFLLLQIGTTIIAAVAAPETAMILGLLLQWLLLPIALWPLVRGVPARVWREQMGLVAPRGVMREIGAGVAAYLAGVPLYVLAAASTMLLILLREIIVNSLSGNGSGGPPVGPSGVTNPVIELIAGHGLLGVVLIGSLVVVWAPLVEESIFRGALYRHMRGRLYWLVAAVFSAVLFGLLHQYDVLMLLPVIALGVVFAVVREWRGSLIGCITGHMLHNGTIFCLVLALVALMG